MRRWIPAALATLVILVVIFFYAISAMEQQGASSLGFANAVGLIVVVAGVVAAGMLLRRASPP
jgi:hypothetical protein